MLLHLTRELGQTCLAEGIEISEQHTLLQTIGIPTYQSWAFAPALTATDFRTLLTHHQMLKPQTS